MVTRLKSYAGSRLLLAGIFFASVFALAWHPILDYDTFFGLKIGEYVATHHELPTKEFFSWAAQGRSWIPYEWLAQTWVYFLNQLGGFNAIQAYVAAMVTVFIILVFVTYRQILKLNFYISIILSIFTYALVYEFFVSRPQIIAFVGFAATVYLIWRYIFRKVNYLYLTPIITYIWANSHASFIFVPALFFSYAIFSYLYLKSEKDSGANQIAKKLALFGLINTVVTVLPPLWLGGYQLILEFIKDLGFMSQFVSEWNPLPADPLMQLIYTAVIGLAFLFIIWRVIKSKESLQRLLIAIPLLVISIFSFSAIRHIPFGTMAALFSAGLFIPEQIPLKNRRIQITVLTFLAAALAVSGFFIYQKRNTFWNPGWEFPKDSVQFLLTHDFHGQMLNEFASGGYMIYYLYPKYQVFFDGRADVYHCCEMRAYWPLITDKYNTLPAFTKTADDFLNKYQFSFAVLPVTQRANEFTAASKLAEVMQDNPNWTLVYIGDHMEILVRHDGQNDAILRDYGMTAVTPYRLKMYRPGQSDQALAEYLKAIRSSDSGFARVGIGQILLEKNRLDEAETQFARAAALNNTIGLPQLGLARVAGARGQFSLASSFYLKALDIDPTLGEAYLELGETYLKLGQPDQAKSIWEKGLSQNLDLISRQKIIQQEAALP